jgi:sugar phosphate isomerase/epimerase
LLLVGPEDIHLTHPDREVRARTAAYLADLARFCGDIGGRVMVLGSPKQRNLCPGVSYGQATDYARGVFEEALPVCESSGVTLCMEPLSTAETDFCASAQATLDLVQAVDHPCFRMMLDAKAMTTEEEDRPALIRRFAPWMRHFHANDPNLNGPGWGDLDYGPIFEALREVGYDGYLSIEVFLFEPGPEAIARKSLEYLRRFA